MFSDFLKRCASLPVVLGVLLIGGALATTRINLRETSQDSLSSTETFFVEGDTWWHIAVGNEILKTHSFPTADHYSFTARGTRWIAYEWLGEVVMALAWNIGGPVGLLLLLAVVIAGIMLLLYWYAGMICENFEAAFLASAIFLPLTCLSFTMRPQVIGYLFLLVTLICLGKYRRGNERALWILPPLFALWVNVHGTFVLGFFAFGVYAISGLWSFDRGSVRARRWTPGQRLHIELAFLLSMLALALTPYGFRIAAYPLQMAFSQPVNVGVVGEWLPLNLIEPYGKIFLLVVFFVVASQIVLDLGHRLEDVVLFVVATASTIVHARFILLFVPVACPLVAKILARWLPERSNEPSLRARYAMNVATLGLVCFLGIKFFPSRPQLEAAVASSSPAGAVRYLREHPMAGKMFNDSDWGGYLIAHEPSQKVFIDGRLDIYEYSGVLQDYLAIIRAQPNYASLLHKYEVSSCLVPPRGALSTLLAASSEWRELYSDGTSRLFVRERISPPRGPAVQVRRHP